MVPLHKGKKVKGECFDYRDISLLAPGKLCGKVVNERVAEY